MKHFKVFLLIVCTLALVCGACGKIKTIPTPEAPQNLFLEETTETSLTFQWDAVKNASSYEWALSYLDPYSGLAGYKRGSVMTKSVTINDLYPGTTYTLQVRTVAFGLLSDWSEAIYGITQGEAPSI